MDLAGKRLCSHDISSASCAASSTWIEDLASRRSLLGWPRENPYDSLEGCLHFNIDLIPPGGEIDVLAKDFVLEPVP